MNPKTLHQLQYCEENLIPFAVIIGQDEVKAEIVKLRDVKTRDEVEKKWFSHSTIRFETKCKLFSILDNCAEKWNCYRTKETIKLIENSFII